VGKVVRETQGGESQTLFPLTQRFHKRMSFKDIFFGERVVRAIPMIHRSGFGVFFPHFRLKKTALKNLLKPQRAATLHPLTWILSKR
jgi:hypothetical protein